MIALIVDDDDDDDDGRWVSAKKIPGDELKS